MVKSNCKAVCRGDCMYCNRCHLSWDLNDPEPPECVTDEELKHRRGREALDKIKEALKDHD